MRNIISKTTLPLLLPVILLMTGCSKSWLDKKPNVNQAIATSLEDFQAILDDITNMNGYMVELGEVSADGHFINDASWALSSSINGKNAYTWTQSPPYRELASWMRTYKRVTNVNIILDGLAKFKPATETQQKTWKHIRGQALFHRAWVFYWLSQIYALPYNAASAGTDPGIPIRLDYDVTTGSRRASVQETYQQILRDVNEAKDLLPEERLYASRAHKPAAYALLARIYLAMDDYENCFTYADKCLQLHHALLDFNQLSTGALYIGGFNKEVIFHDQLHSNSPTGFLTGGNFIDTSLYNRYATNDLRKPIYYRMSGTNIIFRGNYNLNIFDLFCGMATDEMYLVRAECFARAGKTTEAMNDLNTLLRTRWVTNTYTDLTAANAEEALKLILEERRKELVLRGTRWADLRRLNKDNRFKITLSRTINSKTYTLEPNSYKYTFPFPTEVLQLSSMPQTPGW